MEQQHTRRGYFIAILSAMILAWTGIFIRYVSVNYGLPSLILAFWRNFFVIIVLLPILLLIKPALLKLKRKDLGFMLLFGLVLAMFNSFWTTSVALTGAAVATVLVYSSSAFTAILDAIINKEKIDWIKASAVVLCLAGCVLVSGALDAEVWSLNAVGIIAGIFSGFLYAVYTLFGRSAAGRGINTWSTIFYTFLIADAILLSLNVLPLSFIPGTADNLTEMLWLGEAWQGWLALFLLAAGPTIMGYGTYNLALRDLPSSVVNLIVTSEPVFTTLVAVILLGEQMNLVQIIGSILIMVGVVLMRVNLKDKNRKNDMQTEPLVGGTIREV